MNLSITLILAAGIFFFLLPIVRDTGAEMFFNLDALLIIGGGTLIGLLVGFPAKRIKAAFSHIKEAFRDRDDRQSLLKEIMAVAGIYKKGNIREVEGRLPGIKNDFFRLGVNLLINHHPLEEIKNVLEQETAQRIVNYNLSQNILKTLSRLAPALGLAGTIISLIKMFDRFQSVETMTPLLAVALMSTFYGVIIANLIMLPLSSKLKEKSILFESSLVMIIEALTAISQREHPLKIEEKLAGVRGLKEMEAIPLGSNVRWGGIKIGV